MFSAYPEAQTHHGLAVELSREFGDALGRAHTHGSLAMLLDRQGRYREALEHAQQALSLCREDGERLGQAGTLNTIGWLHAQLGDYQQALTYCQESLELQRVLGDPHLVLADHDAARNTWEQARTILEDLQHSDAEGGSVAVGVVVPAHRGRFGGRRGRSGTRHHE